MCTTQSKLYSRRRRAPINHNTK